jgi:MFS family permease
VRGRRRSTAVAALLLAQVLVLMEGTVVNVSLSTIEQQAGLGPATLPWVVSAYVVAFGGGLLAGGRFTDVVGSRRAVVTGMTAFAAASAVCALSSSAAPLLAGRVVQGLGAAIVVPAVMGTVRDLYADDPAGLRRGLAMVAATTAVGAAAGLLLGGLVAQVWGWRGIFWINVPTGALVVAVALPALSALPRPVPGRRLPWGQALVLCAGVGASLVAVSALAEARDPSGWWTVVGCAVLGVGALVALVLRSRRSRDPLLPVELFADPGRALVYAVTLAVTGGSQAVFFYLQLTVQRGLSYGPLEAGLAFLPVVVVMLLSAPASARLLRVVPDWVLVGVGSAVTAVGLVLSAVVVRDPSYLGLLGPMVLVGAGSGVCTLPLSQRAVAAIRPGTSGTASSVFVTMQQLGTAVVLTVLAVLAGGSSDPADFVPLFLVAAAVMAAAGVAALAAHLRLRTRAGSPETSNPSNRPG